MDRKAYWNEKYAGYWRQRVEESAKAGTQSSVVAGDAKTEGDEVYEEVFATYPFRPGRILDVGCAWGRMFPLFLKADLQVSGVDISDAMIEQCREAWAGKPMIESIEAAEAEVLPFADGHFDNLTCLAVFDATYQDRALAEFFRVLKPGGRLYLTGKNTNYAADDRLAMEAEIGARSKGHPNYFTDVVGMLRQIQQAGHIVVGNHYFVRRGDFAEFRHTKAIPEQFYEYFIVIEKRGADCRFRGFSSDHSRTFLAAAGQ